MKRSKPLTNRRSFLQSSALLSAGVWAGTQASLRGQDTPMQRLTAACIGVGGKGASDSTQMMQLGAEIVAICDVDEATLTKKSREFVNAETFTDFREMYDKMGDKFDIVVVSTPDHTHAVSAIPAMQMGKHVYCQKPLTWSIEEARRMREVYNATDGIVTQMGNQGSSHNGLREVVEICQSDMLGDVTEVHVWTNRPVWPQGIGRPDGEDPIPAGLHWENWIGPAEMRPFKLGAYHPFNWRGWVDFGTGALGDMACHTANSAVMGLNLFDPVAVTAVINPGFVDNETFPGNSKLKFEFPSRGKFAACDLYWYDGGNMPSEDVMPTSMMPESMRNRIARLKKEGKTRLDAMSSGLFIKGNKGVVFSPNDYGARYYLLPEADFTGIALPAQTLPRISMTGEDDVRHKSEFVDAIKGTGKTVSNFDYAGRLTETILIGNLALHAGEGKRVEWDAVSMSSPNTPSVNSFVKRSYRNGYSIENELVTS